MGLKKITLDDLHTCEDLNDAYVGGKVLSQLSTGDGHLSVFIADEHSPQSSQSKYVMLTVNDPLGEKMPSLGSDCWLYVHKVDIVDDSSIGYSQQHSKCLVVTSKDARLWIVHKNARDPMFLARTSCGHRWWKREKKRRERIQLKWAMDKDRLKPSNRTGSSKVGRGLEERADSGSKEDSTAVDERDRDGGEPSEQMKCEDRKMEHSSEEQEASDSSKDGHGSGKQETSGDGGHSSEEQQRRVDGSKDGHGSRESSLRPAVEGESSSQSSSSFPVNPDFPDSAFANDESSSSSSCGSSDIDSDGEWTRRARTRAQPSLRGYSYKRLADLRDGDKKQNIIGVVKDFTSPCPSRGSDYYSLLTVVDESEPDTGLRAIFFNKDSEKLPQVRREGDIVCVHRIGAKTFNGRIQVEGGAYCNVIRFSGEIEKKVRAWTGSLTFTLTATERERVRELRRWARKRRLETRLSNLQSVYPNMTFDLLCQVVSVTISKVPPCMVLSIWDGTSHQLKHRKITMEKNYNEGYPEIRDDAELAKESLGYCVDVVVYSKRCMRRIENLSPGRMLYLRNVHCAIVNEMENVMEMRVCGKNGGSSDAGRVSRIAVLSKRDSLCRILETQLSKATSPITVTPHSTQCRCTIADVTGYNGTFPAKFRCRVKLQTVNASSLEDLVVVLCSGCQTFQHLSHDMEMDSNGNCTSPCLRCLSKKMTETSSTHHSYDLPARFCKFYFTLTLTDGLGELDVQVGHEQAMELFGGMKPNNFYQYQHLRLQLNDVLYGMTGGRNPFMLTRRRTEDNGKEMDREASSRCTKKTSLGPQPWLECCILAVKGEDSIIHYCIFDTKLNTHTN